MTGIPLALDEALASFNATDVTVRVVSALLGVLPGSPSLAAYRSLEEVVTTLHAGAPSGLLDTAKELAASKEILNALLIVNGLDTGDKGISMATGLRTAASLFFGNKPGFQVDAQQRSDAAVKALGLAAIVQRVLPGEPLESLRRFASLPSGAATLMYYGGLELALPFSPELAAPDAVFLQDLWKAEGGGASVRLQPIAGKDGVSIANSSMDALLPVLDRSGRLGAAHVTGLAESIQNLLPGALSVAKDSLPDIAATGVDSLPVYRYLAVRAIAEACCARARWMYETQWQPALIVPLNWFEPDPVVPTAAAGTLPPNPFSDEPSRPVETAAAVVDGTPKRDIPVSNPFVDGVQPMAAASAPAPSGGWMDDDPTEMEAAPKKEVVPPTGGWWDDDPAPAVSEDVSLEKAPEPPEESAVAAPVAAVAAPAIAAVVEAARPVEPAAAPSTAEETEWTGIYAHRAGRATIWVVLQAPDAFYRQPPVKAGVLGTPDATWRVEGGELLVRWSEEKEDRAKIERYAHGLLVDGMECRRMDHDFTGFALDGDWKGDTGEYDFESDGTFTTPGGDGGTYELGNQTITLAWTEGGRERLSFLCERIAGERAMVLYIAGEAYRRQ